jgi:hypothetical protein
MPDLGQVLAAGSWQLAEYGRWQMADGRWMAVTRQIMA